MTSFVPEFFLVNLVLALSLYGSDILELGGQTDLEKSFRCLAIPGLIWTGCLFFLSLFASTHWLHNEWNSFFKLLLVCSCIACVCLGQSYLKKHALHSFEYYVFFFLVLLGLSLIISSYDLLGFYLGLELQSLSLYVLVNYQRNSVFSTEAGLKYFLIGAISSGLFVLGCSLVYGSTGSILFQNIGQFASLSSNASLHAGLLLILFALFLKLGAAPFHMWTLEVYDGAPTSISIFLVNIPKIGLVTILCKILFLSFYFHLQSWTFILSFVGFISILVGGLGGSRQQSLKILLIYSGIGHIGYILLGILGGVSLRGAYASLFYLVVYILSNLFLWSIYLEWTNTQGQNNKSLSSLKDFSLTNFNLSIGTVLVWFSLAGIPPFAGFFSKYFVISPAIHEHLYTIVVSFLFVSLVSVYYYLKLIKVLYFDKSNSIKWKNREFGIELPYFNGCLLSIILSILFFFFLNLVQAF